MAGTLTISTLSDGTNSTSATNLVRAACQAWVNFNGVTTVSVNASYNVSSVTRGTTGTYTINFTTAISDANYAVSGASTSYGAAGIPLNVNATPTAMTAPTLKTATQLTISLGSNVTYDSSNVSVKITR